MQIKTWRDPYDAGFNTITPKEITLEPGLTVLVGCNGAGKTTLLMNIKEHCKAVKVPCHMYNNLRDGGDSHIGSMLAGCGELPSDDLGMAISIWTASEGEAIKLNLGRQSTLYKEFLHTGNFKNRSYRFSRLFSDDKEDKLQETNIRVLLFDATDSGLSIDNVCDIKRLFKLIRADAKEKGLELYLIISANEYELCRGEQCFDVNRGIYLTFNDYEDYRKFILKSRERKENRIARQIKWREKQEAKEKEKYEKLKETIDKEIEVIKSKSEGSELSYSDRSKIEKLERKLEDFVRQSRFLSDK